MGEDVSQVFSCSVPVKDGQGGHTLRGCPFAGKKGRCFRMFNGRNPRIGDFGPKTEAPGDTGHGPENVPFALRTADGDEFESFMPCHRFLIAVYPRMLAARDPREPSGEKIRILGKAGEAQIVQTFSLPEEPKRCNKNGNNTMVHETTVSTCPKHVRPFELDPRWKERAARDRADMAEESAAYTEDDDAGVDVASDEPDAVLPPEPVAVTAEAAPVIRRRKP